MRRLLIAVSIVVLLTAMPIVASAHEGVHLLGATGGGWSLPVAHEGLGGLPARVVEPVRKAAATAEPPGAVTLVGHTPLLNRGMNAALAMHGDFAYVGSRTDGSHRNAGVLIVDIKDPANPVVVNQIGRPTQANPGETSRELRVWTEQELLIVANFRCAAGQHRCSGATVRPTFRFYDIAGEHAAAPRLVSTYYPSATPHEFFLWDDPRREGRALLYVATYGSNPGLVVADISRAREGVFSESRHFSLRLPGSRTGAPAVLHSVSVSVDGTRAYLAYMGGGFLVADTSQFADAATRPVASLITPVANRVPPRRDPGAHSAVKVPGRDVVVVTEETYVPCPWAGAYTIDVGSETTPRFLADYWTLPFNDPRFCGRAPRPAAPKTAHNPTLTRNLALISWHSRGLQVVSLENPARPVQLAEYLPDLLPNVATGDDLTTGTAPAENIAFWSYPIIRQGLIYVVDVRNGLFVLRYRGPLEDEVASVTFLEGNSNLGDAAALEAPPLSEPAPPEPAAPDSDPPFDPGATPATPASAPG